MKPKKVSIVGAGISGLSLAYFLNKKNLPVRIYEASQKPGGLIKTYEIPGLGIAESGANAFLNSTLLETICSDLNLELIPTLPSAKKRYLFHDFKFTRWPLHFFETLYFIYRLFLFLLNKSSYCPKAGESVSAWASRVFGQKFSSKLIDTILKGIYAAPSESLSASLVLGRFFSLAILPHFAITKTAISNQTSPSLKPKRRGSVSFKNGMGSFMESLASYLQSQGVECVYNKKLEAQDLAELKREGPLVLAGSLPHSAELLAHLAPSLSLEMKTLPMQQLTSGTLIFPESITLPKGFGALISSKTAVSTLGVLFNHNIFPGRTQSENLRSETWILEGSLSEEEFLTQVKKDRALILKNTELPLAVKHFCWNPAFPVYGTELETFLRTHPHLPKVESSLFLTGNYLGRIGLAQILEQNRILADLISEEFEK